jgi:hypothetical protein
LTSPTISSSATAWITPSAIATCAASHRLILDGGG